MVASSTTNSIAGEISHTTPADAEHYVTVIVPVRNSPKLLRQCIQSLQLSTFDQFQLIVVDDASTDGTSDVAREMGVQLVRLTKHGGPSIARNRGAAEAAGDILVFIDADVSVHKETLGYLVETLRANNEVDAVFGSYDDEPTAQNSISVYKNLFHHYVHQTSSETATTFWSGCGAVRKSTFLNIGGFDTHYDRPRVEDIELGVRLCKAGKQIVLNKAAQVTHLKRWTLNGLICADVRDRGIPWTRLIMREGNMPDDLNLKRSQRTSAVLACMLWAVWTLASWQQPWLLVPALASFLLIQLSDFCISGRRANSVVEYSVALLFTGSMIAQLYLSQVLGLLAIVLVVGIVLINIQLYVFFLRHLGIGFAIFVFPLHALYYLYGSIAFALGVLGHVGQISAKPHPVTVASDQSVGRSFGTPSQPVASRPQN